MSEVEYHLLLARKVKEDTEHNKPNRKLWQDREAERHTERNRDRD